MGAVYIIGIIAGIVMFVAKWCGMILLTGGKKGINIPILGNIQLYAWIMRSHVRRGLLDLALGAMVAHIFAGSILGMIAAITFAAISMAFLMSDILWDATKIKYASVRSKYVAT